MSLYRLTGRRAAGAALILAASAGSASAALMFEKVMGSSDAIPSVPGATWNTSSSGFFGRPAIDNDGRVVFRGQMTNGVGGVQSTNPANQAGYWYGAPGSLTLIARDGTAGPTLPNAAGWVHNTATGAAGLQTNSPTLAPNGTLLASSKLNGTTVAPDTVWTGAYNNMQLVGQHSTTTAGYPRPAGTTHAVWSSGLLMQTQSRPVNNAGQTPVYGNIATDGDAGTDVISGAWSASNLTNDSGVWVASPSGSSLVAREGGSTAIAGTIYGEMATALSVMNGSGKVAFVGGLRGTIGGVVATGSTGLNDSVLFSSATSGGSVAAIARKNDPVPGLSGVNYYSGSSLAFYLSPQAINNSGRVVYDATFGTGSGTGNEALMTWADGAAASVLFRTGDTAAGVSGATWSSFNTTNSNYRLNNNNTMIFTAKMAGTSGTADDDGIWMTKIDSSGNATGTQLAVREGQAIPGYSGLTLGSTVALLTSAPMLNNKDQFVFEGSLAGTGVTTANDNALFAWDPNDGLMMLLREGDSAALSVSGLSGTIGNNTNSITPFAYTFGGGNGEGGTAGFSDTGWLTLNLTLQTAGISNINVIRTQVPEPASLGLLSLCGFLATRRRK
jgi:hypothetical protein